MKNGIFTSESVTEGHPDKVCDCVSDAILDEYLKHDPNARVACETLASGELIVISGEVDSKVKVDVEPIARKVLNDIGYNHTSLGVDGNSVEIIVKIHEQSSDIARGVVAESSITQGAGDQGLMFGYACNETEELMPLPIQLSHRLAEKLTQCRKNNTINWLRPDGKTQVSVNYKDGVPTKITRVVLATQHDDLEQKFGNKEDAYNEIRSAITDNIIVPVLEQYGYPYDDNFIINGTGWFVIGGPAGDTGLTGRKIIVDTYGGYARHGGGAFSGKDPSKVDRSAAYYARYIAKNIVSAGIANHCEVQIAYSIGVAEPVSVSVDSFGTSDFSNSEILYSVNKVFNLRPYDIIDSLKLKNPIYKSTSAYGHFGRDGYSWEKTDKVDLLLEMIKK